MIFKNLIFFNAIMLFKKNFIELILKGTPTYSTNQLDNYFLLVLVERKIRFLFSLTIHFFKE